MSHSNTSAYYPEELAIANKRIEKLTDQLDQTLTQLEAAQSESRRGWGRATSLESQLEIVVGQREESQDQLAAAQAELQEANLDCKCANDHLAAAQAAIIAIDEATKPLVDALKPLMMREDGHYVECPASTQETHDTMPNCKAVQHCKRLQAALAQVK